jgi:hypothetical protein
MRPSTGDINGEIKHVLKTVIINLDSHLSAARTKASTIRLLGQLNQLTESNHHCHRLRDAMLDDDFIPLFLRKLDVIYRFESLSEYSLNLLKNLCSSEDIGTTVVDQFVTSGGIIYVLSIIKTYLTSNPRICDVGGRLLAISVQAMRCTRNLTTFTDYDERRPLIAATNSRFDRATYADLKQQLVLHGVASVLPKLIRFSLEVSADIEKFSDLVECARFLVIECSGEVTNKLLSVDNYSLLESCVYALYVPVVNVRSDAATIIIGLVVLLRSYDVYNFCVVGQLYFMW